MKQKFELRHFFGNLGIASEVVLFSGKLWKMLSINIFAIGNFRKREPELFVEWKAPSEYTLHPLHKIYLSSQDISDNHFVFEMAKLMLHTLLRCRLVTSKR